MPETLQHNLLIRSVNRAGSLLRRLGVDPLALDAESWKARARRETGLHDFAPTPRFEEGLSVLARSAREEAQLSTLGRFGLREHVQNALVTRLRRIELRRRGALDEPGAALRRPVIIAGPPRSGTSFLHRILSAPDAYRTIPFWQVSRPNPGPGPDERRQITERNLALMKKVAPSLDSKHHMTADTAEECHFLIAQSLCSTLFWVVAPTYAYLDWLLGQDMRPAYQEYREQLMLLQRETPEQRLILKAPMHFAYVRELAEAIPEACIVQTHRDPVPITLSNCSLTFTTQTAGSERVDARRLIDKNVELLLHDMRRNLAGRAHIPPERVLDIQYEDLIADPAGTVQRVHEHFSLPHDEQAKASVAAEIARRPQHRFGKHEYDAADLGLDPARLQEAFAPYLERFRAGQPTER